MAYIDHEVLLELAKVSRPRSPGLTVSSFTKVGAFAQALYDEAKQKGWVVISMKNDSNEIFPPTTVGRGTR